MIRVIILAATAALALAAPASAQSIRISTVGKTSEQVNAEVVAAANTVCRKAVTSATFPNYEMAACVKETIAKTYARAKPATQVAQR